MTTEKIEYGFYVNHHGDTVVAPVKGAIKLLGLNGWKLEFQTTDWDLVNDAKDRYETMKPAAFQSWKKFVQKDA